MTDKRIEKILWIILAIVFLVSVYVCSKIVNEDVPLNSQPAIQSFDHGRCMYPARASNPPDGCDNSDPACPEIIKGGICPADIKLDQETVLEEQPIIMGGK